MCLRQTMISAGCESIDPILEFVLGLLILGILCFGPSSQFSDSDHWYLASFLLKLVIASSRIS